MREISDCVPQPIINVFNSLRLSNVRTCLIFISCRLGVREKKNRILSFEDRARLIRMQTCSSNEMLLSFLVAQLKRRSLPSPGK